MKVKLAAAAAAAIALASASSASASVAFTITVPSDYLQGDISLGTEFTPNSAMTVTALGYYDYTGAGF